MEDKTGMTKYELAASEIHQIACGYTGALAFTGFTAKVEEVLKHYFEPKGCKVCGGSHQEREWCE
jgi:hypothetical protein